MDREFKGVWVPKEIWLDKNLTLLDKAIMVEIDSLDKTEIGCWAGNEHFAEMFGCTTRKVSDSVSKLIDKGYVKVIRYDGRKRYLRSCMKVVFTEMYNSFQSDTNGFSSQTDEIFHSDSRNVPYSNPYREPMRDSDRENNNMVRFDDFWSVYPNKVKKKDARTAWKSSKLDGIADTIIDDVKQRCATQWKGKELKYVPHPTTYLHQRRWEDETRTDAPIEQPRVYEEPDYENNW